MKVENVHRLIKYVIDMINSNRNMVEDLNIKCRYAREGCEELFKIGDLKHHAAICPYQPIACPNSGCDFIAARRLIKDHTANCEFKTEIC